MKNPSVCRSGHVRLKHPLKEILRQGIPPLRNVLSRGHILNMKIWNLSKPIRTCRHAMFPVPAVTLSGETKNVDACNSLRPSPPGWRSSVGNALAAGKQGASINGMPMKCNERHNDGN